jgi:serine/threonine protein kinase
VLYELLTGTPPFAGDSPVAVASRHVTEQPTPPSQRNPQVGVDLEAVMLTALAKDPAGRYQTATAMAQDLERVADATLPGACRCLLVRRAHRPTSSPASSLQVRRRWRCHRRARLADRPGRLGAAGGVGVVVPLAVALWLRSRPRGPTRAG